MSNKKITSDHKEHNPLEELRKKIEEALGGQNVTVTPMQEYVADEEDVSGGEPMEDEAAETLARIREFNLKPREIRDYLNRFVIQQQEAKKVLSVAICDHYNHVRQCMEDPKLAAREYQKQNIILLGPTGVGKTYLMRCISKLIGVPFVKADATKFSETGYVGSDVEDLVRDLVKVAGGNQELAQYGIIYIDEIDKIAAAANAMGRDVSGRGVQINLLKLMEDAEVNLFTPTDMMSQMQAMMEMQRTGKARKRTISTKHILFIVSGAFDKLAENVKRRVETSAIGFTSARAEAEEDASRYLRLVETTDFIKYGFEPEFIGRLPVRVACDHLGVEDLAEILTSSEGSILEQYRADFTGYGIDTTITPEGIREIARRAFREKTGARGLMTVFERIFRSFKFELPSSAVKSFEVTTDTIQDPEAAVVSLLLEHKGEQRNLMTVDVRAFAKRFKKEHGIDLEFDDEACEALIEEAIANDTTIRALCERKFHDYQHGLAIISRHGGGRRFRLSGKHVKDPDRALSEMVVESFRQEELAAAEALAAAEESAEGQGGDRAAGADDEGRE